MRLVANCLIAAGLLAVPAVTSAETFGGQHGADMSIAASEPDQTPVHVGLAGAHPADIARYLLANGAGSARLSPDGQSVAFIRTITGQPELWVVPVLGGQPRQLTFRAGVDDFHWLPDSSGLIYAADRDGSGQPGYYRISSDGMRESVVLPPAKGDFRQFGGFSGPDAFIYASTRRDGLDFDIYRATLSGHSEMIVQGHYAYDPVSVSPDGHYAVVSETVGEDADNLFLLDLGTHALKTIAQPDPRADNAAGGFAWAPDSSYFLYASNAGREFAALTRYNIARASSELLRSADGDIRQLQLCGAARDHLTYTVRKDGFDKLFIKPPGSLAVTPDLPAGHLQVDCAGGTMLVRVANWQTPGDLYIVDPANGSFRRIFAGTIAGLSPIDLVRPRVMHYRARDGVALEGLLYLPEDARTGAEAPPVLFDVHGGPSDAAGPTYDPVIQYFVNRGVAVFAPNVRGSTGFGRTYTTLDDGERRLDAVRDLVDLLDGLGKDGLVDKSRAAVMGHSYGGYMVNAVLAAYPGTFRAGISMAGVGNWVTALEVATPMDKASDRIEFGDIREQRWKDFYRQISPVFHADRIRVPMLFEHGVKDTEIDISQTEMMVQALRKNGIETEFVRLPDEGHDIDKLSDRLFFYRKAADFVGKQLGLARGQ